MHILPYLGIVLGAAVEGEVIYCGAVVMASLGQLNPAAVLISGCVGGWAGDQFFFYIAGAGRARSWLDRFPTILSRRRAIGARIDRHATKMILAVRLLPGLRIAIPVACAYAGISAGRFSGLSLVSALLWATIIMVTIGIIGPASLSTFGLKAWWTPLIPAVLLVIFCRWLARSVH